MICASRAWALAAAIALASPALADTSQRNSLNYEVAAPTLGRIVMAIHASSLPATEGAKGRELVFAYADALRKGDRSRAEAALQTWVGQNLQGYEAQLNDTVRMLGEIVNDPQTVGQPQLTTVATTILESAQRPVPATLSQTLEVITRLAAGAPHGSQHDLRWLYLMSAEIRHCQAALIGLHEAQVTALRAGASARTP